MIKYYHSASTWMEGLAIEQIKLAAGLPGMEAAAAMPDLHPGLAYPVGAAMRSRRIIYPELVGGDIGCGMALFRTGINAGKFKAARFEKRFLNNEFTPEITDFPAGWPDWLRRDLGTLGLGNHFAELLEFHEFSDPDRCAELEIDRRHLWLLVHCGSRGHGQALLERTPKGGLEAASEAGLKYLERHNRLLDWATRNRQYVAQGFLAAIGTDGELFADNCHNSLLPDSMEPDSWIHRKGAASTEAGAPFVIAGSRGTYSYLVEPTGNQDGNLWSAAHGSGRKWNRRMAHAKMEARFSPENMRRTKLGGLVVCGDRRLLFEEAPEAYKNSESVVSDLVNAGIIRIIGILKPVFTYKSSKER